MKKRNDWKNTSDRSNAKGKPPVQTNPTEVRALRANPTEAPTDKSILKNSAFKQSDPVEWLWEPLIPFGKVTIVQGDKGTGKSTLMLTIAAMLSSGIKPPTMRNGKLFPSEKIEPQNVFCAPTGEELADCTLPRFICNGGDVNRFAYSDEFALRTLLREDDVRSAIEQSNAKLMIVDPVRAFLLTDEMKYYSRSRRMIHTMLSKIAAETGCAIVLVRYMNKTETAMRGCNGLGIMEIANYADSILLVENKERETGLRTIRVMRSNYAESDRTPIGMKLDDERRLHFVDIG